MGKSTKFLFLPILACLTLVLVIPVFAEETTNTARDETSTSNSTPATGTKLLRPQIAKEIGQNTKDRIQAAREKNLEIKENLKNRASEAAQKRKEKLSEARLKLCETRANAIGNRLKTMQQKATVIHKGHEKIYARVDEFYNSNLVPSGYTLSNYSDLKAEIEANKANVQTLLDAAKISGGEFSCTSDDPKGQVGAFQEDMKVLIEANKTYKESIRVFVKAVHELAKTARLEKVSPSPAPEVTE